jgi:hypothetical protein
MNIVYKTFFDGCRELHYPICGNSLSGGIALKPGYIVRVSEDYPYEPGVRTMGTSHSVDLIGMNGYVIPAKVLMFYPPSMMPGPWMLCTDPSERFRPEMSSGVYELFKRRISDKVTLKCLYSFPYRFISKGSPDVLDALVSIIQRHGQDLSYSQIVEISELIVKNLTNHKKN